MSKARQTKSSSKTSAKGNAALEELLGEVRRTLQAVSHAGDKLHDKEPVTHGMRSVLEYLAEAGPSTVPQIASAKLVTRQHIQKLVNGLLENKLVTLKNNPAHKRSSLITPTKSGVRVLERMQKREADFHSKLKGLPKSTDLKTAVDALESVRTSIHSAL